jgi:hypothetical protein
MRPPLVARAAFRRLSPRTRSALLRRAGRFAPWEGGFDLTPPAPEPGEVAGPPDFVGIGVQKAGTSWWYELIAEHPGVSARTGLHKERHYLSHFGARTFGPPQVGQYHGWFPRRPGTITGEWTPDYLAYPWVPALLAEAAPEARLLVMVRDPVERFRSGLSFRLSQGALPTEATEALAVQQGFTATSLRRYLDVFPKEQILVLQYERCAIDPTGPLAGTYRFLGLDDGFRPTGLHRSVNASGQKLHLEPDARRRLVDLYAPDVEDLVGLFPDIDLSLWANFSSGAGVAADRPAAAEPRP